VALVHRTILSEFVFDIATLVSGIGEVRQQHQCMTALARVLRPGGRVVFHVYLPDPDLCSLATLKTLAEGAGFAFVRQWGHWYNYTAAFEKPLR